MTGHNTSCPFPGFPQQSSCYNRRPPWSNRSICRILYDSGSQFGPVSAPELQQHCYHIDAFTHLQGKMPPSHLYIPVKHKSKLCTFNGGICIDISHSSCLQYFGIFLWEGKEEENADELFFLRTIFPSTEVTAVSGKGITYWKEPYIVGSSKANLRVRAYVCARKRERGKKCCFLVQISQRSATAKIALWTLLVYLSPLCRS